DRDSLVGLTQRSFVTNHLTWIAAPDGNALRLSGSPRSLRLRRAAHRPSHPREVPVLPFRFGPRIAIAIVAAIGFLAAPQNASAFSILTGCNGCFGGCGLNLGNNLGQNLGINIGGAGGGGAGATPLLTRTMNNLPTVTNYWQYSQVTGVKP